MKEPEAGEHEVHLNFNPNAMIRVLQLAASVAKTDEDKQRIFAVADLADALMRQHGFRFHIKTLAGQFDSARALVEELVGLREDSPQGADGGEQRRLKRAQELIDEFHRKARAPNE